MGCVGRWVCLALLCGCRREESREPPLLESQGPPQTSANAPELSHPDFACFADVEYDLGQDGTIEGWGFEGYDDEHPTWLMYAVRDENANGLPDAIETYERDAQGNVILFVRQGRRRGSRPGTSRATCCGRRSTTSPTGFWIGSSPTPGSPLA
jgi:hypothetical protein